MAKTTVTEVGRNRPCPCGSGRRARRCCGANGPSPEVDDPMAFLERAARERSGAITHRCQECQAELFMEVLLLPERYARCRLRLPDPRPAALARLADAINDADPDAMVDAMSPAIEVIDTPPVRFALAKAVISLEAHRRLDPEVCALALDDLAGSNHSTLVLAALLVTLSEKATVRNVSSRVRA